MVNQSRSNRNRTAANTNLDMNRSMDPITTDSSFEIEPVSELDNDLEDDDRFESEWNTEPELDQEINELDNDRPSYGTGFHDQPRLSVRGSSLNDRDELHDASPVLTGGDVDANWEQANAVGDESVGGTAPTPDMDIVDELGRAVGLEMDDRAFLRTNEILAQRDRQRWELDPDSAESESL